MARTTDRAQSVVVTGGGSGIGRATARAFAAQGAHVLVVGRTEESLAETAEGQPRIRRLVADLVDRDAPERIVAAALDATGRIDVLINNAAVPWRARLGEIDRERTERQVATNLLGPLFLTQSATPHMPPGATVINISSNPPTRGWPANSVYGSTKVGLDFLTLTWAVELAPRGIRVVSVAPGPTVTPALAEARSGLPPEQQSDFSRVPLGRPARPEEIAWWITEVTRPEAGYLTGAILRVDGGLSVG
ncbi:SDR family oxidoreductase [Streptomyces sp. NBC_01340]|uniref:SDR family NAD(P)-dependent oxidoreductase n=1 Tax=unclassified Streptomyces TaxID=2593676 RepID=UPI00224E5536|nr:MULTISPECIES: SDR family oxidoreductase [unclassified Streptomyces]MCX4457457.1 SDR family oxidoreductase [Streptomyces sp. NBC_01719]MCX4496814.1 SDR family oxidoreductase [Streptomyces sp. NBC_01728]WSI41694.1 SDR family oxidoreductase [Streptomyces sp. NBC_01340]